jgi:prepilin-type processing-associated H-X9-DG protein
MGIIALLLALVLPPLRLAREQAIATQCGANSQQLGHALEHGRSEFNFYPVWDDGGAPMRYTWFDVLVERGYANPRSGYCAGDQRPDFLAEARGQAYGVVYPPDRSRYGVNYSYGISVPLSSGAWAWRSDIGDGRPRRFVDHLRDPARRILAADGYWAGLYNQSGDAIRHRIWNGPTQYDNTIAYRHANHAANFLFQDGHVERVRYLLDDPMPVDTVRRFFWHADERPNVGPDDQWGGNYYPAVPVLDIHPRELQPEYYTLNGLWTQVGRD